MKENIIFYSQANQDKWVCEIFDYKQNGYFIEIGAYDGIQTSNTFSLEKYLGWQGICIEGNPEISHKLFTNRSCSIVNAAVSNYNGRAKFGGDRIDGGLFEVDCYTLDTILSNNECPKKIDYLSIDVEGHELTIFNSFNFNNWEIKLMTVEHNLYCDGPDKKDKLFELLSKNNFTRVLDNAICLDKNPDYYEVPYEDWYINNNYPELIDKMKNFKQI